MDISSQARIYMPTFLVPSILLTLYSTNTSSIAYFTKFNVNSMDLALDFLLLVGLCDKCEDGRSSYAYFEFLVFSSHVDSGSVASSLEKTCMYHSHISSIEGPCLLWNRLYICRNLMLNIHEFHPIHDTIPIIGNSHEHLQNFNWIVPTMNWFSR